MKKLRKDNGGYALAYVLIIVLVLCAVAVSICTVALRNFQSQERSVIQARQLYQAEGEIEKFVALAEDVSGLPDSLEYETEDDAKEQARGKYIDYVESLSSGYALTFDTAKPCKFALTYENETVRIASTISMALDYAVTPVSYTILKPDGTETTITKYKARVREAVHTYNTYTITHLTTEGGRGDETE